MGKIIETTIERFDGGVVNDPRDPRTNTVLMVSNFDILTDSYRMRPKRSSEDGNSSQSTQKIRNFCIGLRTGTTWSLFGLGVTAAATKAEVYYKDITGDLDDAVWNETANNTSSGTTMDYSLFVYYKKTGLLYGTRDSRYIWSYNPGGSVWSDTAKDLNDYSTVFSTSFKYSAQGLVHSKDDILYIPIDNYIIANNNGTWTAGTSPALTLPSSLRITSLCEYGNYIAIACEPVSGSVPGLGNSIVYIWDRDTSLATLSDCINWSDERLLILEDVNGTLIGISISTGSTRFNSRVIFRYLSVSSAKKIIELTSSTAADLIAFKKKINNRLYFLMEITIGGVSRDGVWSIGGSPGEFTLIHENTPNNDGTFTDLELWGFHYVGDYLFMSYSDSATNAMSKTDDAANYNITAIWEKLFRTGNSSLKKDLVGVTVMTEPLPTAGQIILKYKTDHNTSFTQIFKETTNNSISYSAVNADTDDDGTPDAALPKDYKEITLRAESYGGAVITGVSFQEEITSKRVY